MRILLTILVIFSFNSIACSFPERSDSEIFNDAKKVFRAKIIATELATEIHDGEKVEVILATYQLVESYKGDLPRKGKVKELPFGPGNCMVGLMTGLEYVIYLEEHDFVTLPSGSWGFFNSEGKDVAPKLEKLKGVAENGI